VAVQIKYQFNVLPFFDLLDLVFDGEHFRVLKGVSLLPAPVQIIAAKVAAVVAQ